MSSSTNVLSRKTTAKKLGVCERTVDRIPDLPRVRLSARRIGYRECDVDEYLARRLEIRKVA